MGIYVISGKDIYRLEKCLEHLLSENAIEKDNIITYDAESKKDFHLDAALMDCGSISLFSDMDKKAVIIKNPYFLNASSKEKIETKSKEKDERILMLENYLKEPNENTLLVFECVGFDADKRKAEYKLLTKYNATIISFTVMKQWEFDSYVDKTLKDVGIKLSFDARNELLKRVNNDTMSFHKALEKLLLLDKKELDLYDIKALVSLNPDINIFDLCNYFVQKDLSKTLQAVQDMKNANYDYAAMMPMLASRLRSFYQMKKLYELGLDESQITTRLHANPYAVKKSLENCRQISSKQILEYLSQLADIDQKFKSGLANLDDEFESFLLHSGEKYASN